MANLNKKVGFTLQKGAGAIVDEQIQTIIQKKGKDYLKSIAKLNFKNYTKLS